MQIREIIALAVAYLLAAGSIVLSGIGAFRGSDELVIASLLAWMSGCADLTKYFMPALAWRLAENRHRRLAICAGLLHVMLTLLSLSYSLEFFLGNDEQKTKTQSVKTASVELVQEQLAETQKLIDTLGPTTAVVVVDREINDLLARTIRYRGKRKTFEKLKDKCPSSYKRLRQPCQDLAVLKGRKAVSTEHERLTTRLNYLRVKLKDAGLVVSKHNGVLGWLAELMEVSLEDMSRYLAGFKSIALEIASSAAVFFAGLRIVMRPSEEKNIGAVVNISDPKVFSDLWLEPCEGASIGAQELYYRYKMLCVGFGLEPLSIRRFGEALPKDCGITKKKTNGNMQYQNVRWRTSKTGTEET